MKSKTVRAAWKLACTGTIAAVGAWYSQPALADIITYEANSGNTTVQTVDLGSRYLSNDTLQNLSWLTPGPGSSYTFEYVAITFTPTESGAYVFGMTQSPIDPVMILYTGVYDPNNPSTGALVANDDTPAATHQATLGTTDPIYCNGDWRCPQVTYNVTAGQTYTLWVSTYWGIDEGAVSYYITLPFNFYSNGSGVFGAYDPGMSPIDLMQPYYLGSQLGITVDPIFVGGTLRVDEAAHNYSQNFTLSNIREPRTKHFPTCCVGVAITIGIFVGKVAAGLGAAPASFEARREACAFRLLPSAPV